MDLSDRLYSRNGCVGLRQLIGGRIYDEYGVSPAAGSSSLWKTVHVRGPKASSVGFVTHHQVWISGAATKSLFFLVF